MRYYLLPGDEGCGERLVALTGALRFDQARNQGADRLLGQLGVLLQDTDDGFDADRFLSLVPDIIIGDVSHHRVTHLRLAGQERLRAGRHPDDVHAPGAEGETLTLGAEARAFDGDEAPAAMDSAAGLLDRVAEELRQARAEGLRRADVDHQALPEESVLPLLGEIEELIGDDDSAGVHILPQRAASAHRDDLLHAQALEGEDVGSIVDLGGHQPVALTVAGQEGDAHAINGVALLLLITRNGPNGQRCGGFAEGRLNSALLDVAQPFHLIKPTAADDSDGDWGLQIGVHRMSPRMMNGE